MPIETVSEAGVKYATGRAGNLPTPSFTDNLEAFLAGAEWMRKQFTLHGTTDCNACDDGRATLYATFEGRCIACEHAREDSDANK